MKKTDFMRKVNKNWIKEQIVKIYNPDDISGNMERELIIDKSYSNYTQLGYILFALNGSPPKGCAIYQPEHKFLIIISAWGKTKKFENVIIEE